MLRRALARRVDLLTLSFKRQYPTWLFPGESDRDPTYQGHREPDVCYLIDSLNPLTWRAAAKVCRGYDPQVVVIPWWTVYWLPCFRYLAGTCRRAGARVIFLCHNVVEHEAAAWKSLATRMVLQQQGAGFLVHTGVDEANLRALLPKAAILVHPHPVYDHFPAAKGVLPKRGRLELLFFGFVRPYKGLDLLIEAMGELRDDNVYLTIAGEFWEGLDRIQARIDFLGLRKRIELVPRYVSEEDAAEYFTRADAVVLPYRSATGSGVVPFAYHYGRPVIVTRVGGLPEVVLDRETGYVVAPESPRAISDIIRSVSADKLAAMRPAIERMKKILSWDAMADSIIALAGRN